MVICFDLTPQANDALNMLMQSGQFGDTSEAASMALVNYEVIHRAVSKRPPRAVPDTRVETAPHVAMESKIGTGSPIPDLFSLKGAGLNDLDLQEIPEVASAQFPPARWLFGQYNKFLPVKAACRGLLTMLHESPDGVPLSGATKTISTEAWVLGDYLYMLDEASSRSREDAFAAAFPTTAGNGARSRIRFANQFVGDLRQPKTNSRRSPEIKFNGLPSALQFIVCSDAKNPVLKLTKPGAEFAVLPNPILDGKAEPPDRKFSEPETEFLLAHIRRVVPEESSAYVSIISAIAEGSDTPDEVDNYLCRRFHLEITERAEKENQITQTFLTTQRTGAVSRMADLGLLAREKTGLHVRYRATQRGQDFNNNVLFETILQK